MNKIGIGERAPWGNFPKVIRNGDLGTLKREPEYQAAKHGDHETALNLVERLITDDTVHQIKAIIGVEQPKLVPVLAVEDAGKNKIPLAMAEVLAKRLGLTVETAIVQREKVSRTNAGSDHRLVFNPTFDGVVQAGEKYLILDDTLTMGGTLASLRGYIENRGGQVVAAAVMTAHPGALDLAVKPSMLAAIARKHGDAMDIFWKENFNYGIDHLTQGEAGHLRAAASVDSIRNRLIEARNAGSKRLDAGRTQPAGESSEDRVHGANVDAGHAGELQTHEQRRGIPQGSSQAPVLTAAATDENIVEAAEAVQSEQQAMLDGASVAQAYEVTLANYVEAKHNQVARLEGRLENLIEQQEARVQQTQANAPGMFSLPGTKRAWQAKTMREQARLQTLRNRLEAVREIRGDMGRDAPRIQEMATRRMRAENPQLASSWDAMREEQRRLEIEEQKRVLKAREEQRQTQVQSQSPTHGRGRVLSLSRRPD